jgi:hypothetical protein
VVLRMLVLVYFLAQLTSSEAFSCSCASSAGCPGLGGEGGPVFLGTVLEVTDLPFTSDFKFLSSRKARIHVNESFGGLPADISEVEILTGSGGGDCGLSFKPGDVYLIDASIGDDGKFHAGICSYSQKLEFAGAAVRVLRKRRDGYKVPSLTGRIVQYDRDFKGLIGTRKAKPLANTLIRVKGGGRAYETWSDDQGLYELYDVPLGKYDFDPDLPFGTTLSWFIGSDKLLESFDLKRSCEERDIEVFASGSIQGRVLDSQNNVLSNAFVYIMPAEVELIPEEKQLYWESQSKEGFFKFVHIPPGKYLTLVNPDDEQNPGFPYSRTFYPGVHDRTSAGIISVGAGEQVKDADIHVQKQFTPLDLRVRVTWADGQPIRDYVFVEAKGTVDKTAMSHTIQPDAKESVINLSVLPNESYELEAHLNCSGFTLRSNKAHLMPGDGQSELVLVLPANNCTEWRNKRSESNRSISRTQVGDGATIGGAVVDKLGKAIGDAKVTAKNVDTEWKTTCNSDAQGAYKLSELPAGTYKVTAEKEGYMTHIYIDVTVEVGKAYKLEIKLDPPGVRFVD